MEAWEQTVRAALLGTEREGYVPPQVGGAVGELLARMQAAEPERQLLSVAAVLSTYCRAGWSPAQAKDAQLTRCEPEERPACGHLAADRLRRMLAGEHQAVLAEWLAALQQTGQRVPHRYLPALLDLGVSNRNLREFIAAVIGVRGQWLIGHNPTWRYATQEDDMLWETGSADARIAVLRSKRHRDPAAGRQMLMAVWAQEPPEQKAKMLEVFGCGLSMDDEPFLEEALDQKRKEVRKVAAGLLARLPQSRLSQRMLERVRPLIQIRAKRKMLGWGKDSIQIDLTLPAECDKAMQRDGIEPKPRGETGQKAWWLEQMLAVVPPRVFSDESGAEPAELVTAGARHEFAEALLSGWAAGCQHYPEPRWVEALVVAWLETGAEISSPNYAVNQRNESRKALLRNLMAQMPAELSGQIALGAVGKAGLSDFVLAALAGCQGSWSVALTRRVVEATRAAAAQGGVTADLVAAVRDWFALHMDPSLVQEISQGWPTEKQTWEWWSKNVETMLVVLQFRHDMRKEIGQ